MRWCQRHVDQDMDDFHGVDVDSIKRRSLCERRQDERARDLRLVGSDTAPQVIGAASFEGDRDTSILQQEPHPVGKEARTAVVSKAYQPRPGPLERAKLAQSRCRAGR